MARPKSTLKLGRASLAPLESNYSTVNLNNDRSVQLMQDGSVRIPEAEYGVVIYSPKLNVDPASFR